MQILPVIDLLGGQVVRGVAGRRDEYRPVQSVLCDEATPAAVAAAFRQRLGLTHAYVADLDAITGGDPNWAAYQQIATAGLRPAIDAGCRSADQAKSLIEFSEESGINLDVVVGLETIAGPETLAQIIRTIGSRRLIFSLDLKNGRPLAAWPEWQSTPPQQIAGEVLELGIRRMIVLDLARVGVGEGTGTDELCATLARTAPDLEIIAGGGVRGVGDLRHLASLGCDAALVASALHDGRITRDDLICLAAE